MATVRQYRASSSGALVTAALATAYHIVAGIKQGFAKVQNLQEALSVGITEAKHCPPQKQIKA